MTEPLKRSVHITNYYHKSSGGISTSYNNLMAAAAREQRTIRLIVPGEVADVENVNEFARIYYVPAKFSPIFDKRYRVMMPWQYMLKDSAIRNILLDEMPQMIEVTDKYTLSIIGPMIRTNMFKRIGRPMLVHFSCERMDDNIRAFLNGGTFGRWLSRRVIGNYNFPSFDYHIANSSYTADEFYSSVRSKDNPRRSRWLLNKCWQYLSAPRIPYAERIRVCPRGVDALHFNPERRSNIIRREMLERFELKDTATLLLYAGRISPEKNISLLIDMMSELAKDSANDYRLLVAGDGPQAKWLSDESCKIGNGRIILLGHLDKETLANYYANSDVFVHPNPREPFGIAPLEAMASGVATVAPNSGGILSYASDENIWLVEPTGKAFADAVIEAVTNDELRRTKIENALKTGRANTREGSTRNLLATYDEIYEDFQLRNSLFTDRAESSNFDFTDITDA